MRVEPTFRTSSRRHQYGLRNNQLHTRTSAQFISPYGPIQLSCGIAWGALLGEPGILTPEIRNICHTCKLRIPRILPVEVIDSTLEYFDYPFVTYHEGDLYVLTLPDKWRATVTGVVRTVPVVDELPQETERIERWLEHRLVNCFTCL